VAGRAGNAIATAGLRADWHDAHGVVASPSISAAWWPVRPLRLRAAASRSFRTPSWTDRYYSDPSNIGDPDLEPERAWTAELGAGLDLPGGVALSATGFVRDAEDLIDWARPANDSLAPFTIRNVESARFTGLELQAVLPEALGARWTASASLLSVSSSAEAGYSSKYALRPLTETVSISAERTVLESLGLAAHLRHARRRGDGDTYVLLDARASYTLGGARLYVDARNLLDEAHADVTGRPAPRRALAVGVALGR
jgi:iron complex outermembrane receptor protein